MRLIKMLGLTAVAAVAAMALIGASSASATTTALCKASEDPCAAGNVVSNVHMVAGTTVLRTNILTVLCLSSLASATATTALGNPAKFNITSLTWSNCGSNAAHSNCTVTTLAGGSMDVLKTGANVGTATALGTEVLVNCSGLHCVYGGTVEGFGVKGSNGVENGMFNANELRVPEISGFLCPNESFWTALYEPLEKLFGSS